MIRAVFFILFLCFQQTPGNILIPCENDANCEAVVKTSTCSKLLGNYCTCPAGFTFSSDVTKCLKEVLYGDPCVESAQCSHMLSGAQCKNGICECSEGLVYTRGKCRTLVGLNSECRDEIDCFFGFNRESVECKDGKCQCATGFYQRFTNVCRREVNSGDFCIVNSDCVDDDSICQSFKCTSSVGTQTSQKRNASVQTQSLDSVESFSEVQIGKSFPNRRIRSYINYKKLDNSEATKLSFDDESTQFGESCESEHKPCPGLKYSVCRRGFCQCQEGFYEKDGICKAELGELVEGQEYCGTGTFERGKCVCQNNQFYGPNMRTCLKASSGINNSCTQQAQCSPYGAAFCNIQCRCYDYAKYNEKSELCELKKGLEEYCETSATCTVPNTECTSRNTCECKTNYFAQNESCKPGLFSNCEKTDDCAFENAECKIEVVNETSTTDKKCLCKDEFVNVGNSCLVKAKNYNDSCTENEQCKPLLGDKASCIDNKCTCNESLYFNGGKCNEKKELNEQCTKSAECFVTSDPETVECRNGVCHCKFNYVSDTSQNRCRPREKNSSSTLSPLKVITLMLIGSAVVVTSSALKDAYFA